MAKINVRLVSNKQNIHKCNMASNTFFFINFILIPYVNIPKSIPPTPSYIYITLPFPPVIHNDLDYAPPLPHLLTPPLLPIYLSTYDQDVY